MSSPDRRSRAVGTVLGAAVGDALGAPFEFGPPGAFSAKYPPGHGDEMQAGGGWNAGEATDDTQMAVLVADSLLERGGLDLPDLFDRFRRWAAAEPKDIGIQTEDVLTSGDPWNLASARHFRMSGRAAGNGSLMRASTPAVHFAAQGREATMEAARAISALTHGDPAAWEGTAILHDLVRVALDGDDPLAALPGTLDHVHPDHRDRYRTVLSPAWHPDEATEFNGAVWPCLASALWCLRTTSSFESALRAAVDLGGDVTGTLAGSVYGPSAFPARWTAALHVPLPGFGRTLDAAALARLAKRLLLPGGTAG